MTPSKILSAVLVGVVSLVSGEALGEYGAPLLRPFAEDRVSLSAKTSSRSSECPCVYDASSFNLNCNNLQLRKMPVGCFTTYPQAVAVHLYNNTLTEILEADFEVLKETLQYINLGMNDIYYIHPRAFSKLAELRNLNLNDNALKRLPEELLVHNELLLEFYAGNNGLKDLPLSLFSPNIKNNNITVLVYPNDFDTVPCPFTASFGNVLHQDLYNFTYFWAPSEEEAAACQSFGLPVFVRTCRPYGRSGVDCSILTEPLTFSKAAMAVTSAETEILFRAELAPLTGEAPQALQCLPEGVDMTETYRLYSRHSKELVIETFFFDLLELPRYTSEETQSVTLRADTVVLTGPLVPFTFPLTIIARRIVLEKPLLVTTTLSAHAPGADRSFYTPLHTRGRVGSMTVEQLQHGLVTVVLLQGDADPLDDCEPLSDWTSEAESWVKASQLWLSLYCANAVVEGEEAAYSELAHGIIDFVANITTDWQDPSLVAINQRAVKAKQETEMKQQKRQSTRKVPYLTVPVYADMVGYLTENLELYKDAMDKLKLKLEVNAQRMFDTKIGLSERKADLEVIQSSAGMAVDKAQATMGAHENQLDNLYQQTFVMWNTITITHNEVEVSKAEVEAAEERVEKGLEAYKRRRRFLTFLDYASMVTSTVKGEIDLSKNKTSVTDFITDTIMNVGDFISSWAGHESEIGSMIVALDEVMRQVNAIVALAPPEPPSSEDMAVWLDTFKDTEEIIEVVTNQTAGRLQWQEARDTCGIVLGDEELSDAVDGVRQLKMAIFDLIVKSESLSEHIKVFANLIISINQQASVVEEDKAAVASSQQSLAEANELLSDSYLTEENYLYYMVDQNVALAKLMVQLYLKNRVDLMAAFNVLGEYCDAYFYTFMKECPIQASYWDDYDTMVYKLRQLDVLALDAIGSLDPPPQPFAMTFMVFDEENCEEPDDPRCPVTQLAYTGISHITLSDWWGPELGYTDRVRIDRIRLYLEGLDLTQVTLSVTRPMTFNDTWHGDTHHFTGHVTNCLIIYQDLSFTGHQDADYITDCSTDHNYDQYYYRSTPYGIFKVVWSDFVQGNNHTELMALQVYVEGSWIPRL
ncbi:uncharacterized protein LOC119574681 [Penaeus monodon]|uniref:uncharacterized protein LOC119574681 n=1 Tax=Penaeus monodon TaxID=6687 RepID=UPI0018A74F9F|nr:uncharacterized protein LOC119574681 [Penaeus monodon]